MDLQRIDLSFEIDMDPECPSDELTDEAEDAWVAGFMDGQAAALSAVLRLNEEHMSGCPCPPCQVVLRMCGTAREIIKALEVRG